MFGMGFGEIVAIIIVATLVFGPERLPGLAKQAAGFIRTVRQMAESAKSDLVKNLGDEFNDLNLDELRSLDPRHVVRDTILGPTASTATTPNQGQIDHLRAGEKAPFDNEAT